MALIIPYTFKAGTKAKAAEVNANFQQTKQFVDSLETMIGEHDVELMSMKDNKADVNGSSNNRFRVADPVSSKDAVNKSFLTDSIENTIEVIKGLKCSKNSYSVITVSPGMCYDSTGKEAIRSYNYINYTTPSKAKNAKYNIFICGNDTDGDVKVTISTNNLTPDIPSGYTYYRRIGGLRTDSSGNISYVFSGDDNDDIKLVQIWRDGYSYYKIYSNGWIEQGGKSPHIDVRDYRLKIHKTMADTNYHVMASSNRVFLDDEWDSGISGGMPIDTNTIKLSTGRWGAEVFWQVQGFMG